MKNSILFCLLLLISISSRIAAQQPDSVDTRVDAYIKQQMEKYQIPGLSLGVVKDGRLVKAKGYGLASVEFDVPASENTIYQLFSVSKIFAGVAVMKLVEQNKLSLDKSIATLIAGAPDQWKEIRVKHLLSHTSGLPEVQANPKFACLTDDKKKEITPEQELSLLKELPLKFKPGERWAYHISGYHLLSYIIEKVSGQSYDQFLQTTVFGPLSMNATRFGSTEMAIIKGRSPTSYNRQNGTLRGWVYPFSTRDFPASALNSSVPDLARFLIALDKGSVLENENRAQLWAPAKLTDGTEKNYGLGWSIDKHKGKPVVGHEGGGAIWVAHFPEDHLSVIVLCNLNGARADEIQFGVAEFYLR